MGILYNYSSEPIIETHEIRLSTFWSKKQVLFDALVLQACHDCVDLYTGSNTGCF